MAILTFGQMNKRQGIPSIELLRQQAPGHDGFHVVGVSALEATDILYNKCIWIWICVHSLMHTS